MRNLLLNRRDLKAEQLEGTRQLMNRAIPDYLITNHMALVPSLSLPDPADRHVLAAAICGKAEVIVTFNEKDFPDDILAGFGIQIQHPDEFICHLIPLDWSAVCGAVKNQRASLKNPPLSAHELFDTLKKQGLALTVSQLRPLADLF